MVVADAEASRCCVEVALETPAVEVALEEPVAVEVAVAGLIFSALFSLLSSERVAR